MARNKKSRRKPRPNRTGKALRSALTRVFTGIPKSVRTSPDPPMIPTFIDYTIRVRYVIRFTSTTAAGEFAVAPPPTAWQHGFINLYRMSPPIGVYQIHLDHEDVYNAAAMRAFGATFDDASITANPAIKALKDETEFSIQSVTAWGSTNVVRYAPITLAVDFANGTPGVTVSDEGNVKTRSVCKVVNSRLTWDKYGRKTLTDAFAVLRIGFSGETTTGYFDAGVIDAVVRMRRSFNAIITPGTRITDDMDE